MSVLGIRVWVLKAVVQKTISFLPFKNKINYAFQKYVTKGVYLTTEYFYDRLEHGREHINAYKKYNAGKCPDSCLELGTGWYPVVPVALFLTGANKIYSVDISPLSTKERVKTTLLKFTESYDQGLLKDYVQVLPARYTVITQLLTDWEKISFEEILKQLCITYLIEDARNLSLASHSINLINSNNTFEHIYPELLKGMLVEFKRVVSPKGIMSHFVDMSDHFAHFDKSISVYNYLKFSDAQWKLIDNSIQPQNRLRLNDYKKIYAELNIPVTEEVLRKGEPEVLKTIIIDQKFLKDNLQDIAVTHCLLISQMA